MIRFFISFFIFSSIVAQEEQAWVFFTSKNVEVSLLDNPSEFLTAKAISRKERHEIVIDEKDFPLDQNRVRMISNEQGINYVTQSKWFNAVYVKGEESDIRRLSSLEFVASIFFMNRGLNNDTSSKERIKSKKEQNNKFIEESTFEYGRTSTQINQINLAPLHDKGFSGQGMTIAVLDSGFENVDVITGFERSRINSKILGGYDFPNRTDEIFQYKNSDHGTSVLSCMTGFIEGQFVGSAPDASYYLFRTEIAERESPEEEALWIAAAERADSLGVDVLNTSLGYTTFDDSKYDYSPADMDGKTTFISQGVTLALEKGMIPVTSAGNTGGSPWRIISAPADSNAALSIGAVDFSGEKAAFSAFGPTADNRIKPDVVALGQGTSVLNDQGNIVSSNGTSFSGPIVAGAVACLWQAFPNKKPKEIKEMIRVTASLSDTPNSDLGFGIANFGLAYSDAVLDSEITEVGESDENDLISTFVDYYLIINERLVGSEIQIFDLQGRLVLKTKTLTNKVEIHTLQDGIYAFRHSVNDEVTVFVKN